MTTIEITTATCNVCERTLPIESFHRNAQSPRGHHPWCRECKNAHQKARYHRDPETARANQKWRSLKSRTGLTRSEWEAKMEAQNGLCAICSRPAVDSRGAELCVDHDHATGQIRDLLCTPCNLAIGYMQDEPHRLEMAAAYLRRWSPSQ